MLYDELQVKDEDLHTEIFSTFETYNVKTYKDYKKLNIINKLKIENNIVAILKIHDEDDDLHDVSSLKGFITYYIDQFNYLNYIGGK